MTQSPSTAAGERELWDKRYAAGQHLFGEEPSNFLRGQAYRLRAGMKALSVADGQGRNGVWLAEMGLDVLAVDISPIALEQSRELAHKRGVRIRTEAANLVTWKCPLASFDVVVEISVHFPGTIRTQVHQSLAGALKPGGLYLLEAFHERQSGRTSGGPKDPDMLSSMEKLRSDFQDLELLELLEGTIVLDEGPKHQGEAWVVRMVGRKKGD
jgi:SAM-dependent methyltransferase